MVAEGAAQSVFIRYGEHISVIEQEVKYELYWFTSINMEGFVYPILSENFREVNI